MSLSYSSTRRSYIFTLDSLGSAHPQVVQTLKMYLGAEAKDKKKIALDSAFESFIVGKQAPVRFLLCPILPPTESRAGTDTAQLL